MKKALFIIAVLFCIITNAQQKTDFKALAKEAAKETNEHFNLKGATFKVSDTVTVAPAVKFIKINNRVFPVEAFKQPPVFLSIEAWNAVLEIINTRDYGKLPASVISQIIQAIGQQLPPRQ